MIATSTEIRVKVADYAVAAEGTIATIGLGSCVAIVLYDSTALDAGSVAARGARGAFAVTGAVPAGAPDRSTARADDDEHDEGADGHELAPSR